MKHNVFISYSRQDKDIIEPVVKLIRALKNDRVFQDIDNIIAGKKWEPQLMKALEGASTFILFWCSHSAKSTYVRKEYKSALRLQIDILPIILDGSKLPKTLSLYQGIDLSKTFIHGLEVKSFPEDDNLEGADFPYHFREILLIFNAVKSALEDRLISRSNI